MLGHDAKPSNTSEQGPSRQELVTRGIVPRPEFQVCGACAMPSSCRTARHCCGIQTTRGNQNSQTPSAEWPFYQLAAARREEIEKIDRDVVEWLDRAETLVCDAVNSREEVDMRALRAHLQRVVAVRA